MYIKPLNYTDTINKVVTENFGGKKLHHLNIDNQMYCIGLAHKIMRQHIIQQKNNKAKKTVL